MVLKTAVGRVMNLRYLSEACRGDVCVCLNAEAYVTGGWSEGTAARNRQRRSVSTAGRVPQGPTEAMLRVSEC